MGDSFVHAVAGSLGGAGAMAITYPLEQIRTLQQAGNESVIMRIKEGGITLLYQGCTAVLETVAVSNFLYFYSAQYAKNILSKRVSNPIALSLCSSTLAGAANVVLTEPLWKANTVLKTMPSSKARKENLLTVLLAIVRREGVHSLWTGTRISLWLVSNPIIQFSVYEFLKRLKGKGQNLSSIQAFVLGAVSKMVATLLTYPLQVAQTRLRMPEYRGVSMLSVLEQILKDRGAKGLYQGCCLPGANRFIQQRLLSSRQ
jgi:adenine nucleotide transporter 17